MLRWLPKKTKELFKKEINRNRVVVKPVNLIGEGIVVGDKYIEQPVGNAYLWCKLEHLKKSIYAETILYCQVEILGAYQIGFFYFSYP